MKIEIIKIEVTPEVRSRVHQLDAEHGIKIVELMVGECAAICLAWRDLDLPAIIVRLEDYTTQGRAIEALVNAWDVSQDQVAALRAANLAAAQDEANGATKQ